MEIVVLFNLNERSDWDQLLQLGVNEKTFRLGCTPAINLFPHTADPILVEPTRYEYPVTPDARRRESLEVFSIESVVATNPVTSELAPFEPFYSYKHGATARERQIFWHTTRRQSERKFDESTDLWITLVDVAGKPTLPEYDTITIRTFCTNRELPSRLALGDEDGDFEVEGASAVSRVVALRKPTNTLRPALSSGALWRLISHLSLNYLSLVEEGREALQEILRLYSPVSNTLERQIEGLTAVSSQRHFARVVSEHGISFVRGTRVSIEVDEDYFVGSGAYLFGSVLECFLGLYVSMNSFTQTTLRTRQRKEIVRQWPARAGHRILV
jgi:type VI secretion system protein ImpG